jgi:hypothetical protein
MELKIRVGNAESQARANQQRARINQRSQIQHHNPVALAAQDALRLPPRR